MFFVCTSRSYARKFVLKFEHIFSSFYPSAEDIEWAVTVLLAEKDTEGVLVRLEEQMIDAPVSKRTRLILYSE